MLTVMLSLSTFHFHFLSKNGHEDAAGFQPMMGYGSMDGNQMYYNQVMAASGLATFAADGGLFQQVNTNIPCTAHPTTANS